MAVNLPAPRMEQLFRVAGVDLGVAMAGVRKANRKDVLVIRLAEGALTESTPASVTPHLSSPKPAASPAPVKKQPSDTRPRRVQLGNQWMRDAATMHVTSAAGTDLRIQLAGASTAGSTGITDLRNSSISSLFTSVSSSTSCRSAAQRMGMPDAYSLQISMTLIG